MRNSVILMGQDNTEELLTIGLIQSKDRICDINTTTLLDLKIEFFLVSTNQHFMKNTK